METNVWYNVGVAKKFEKKGENLSLKVQPSLLETLGQISEKEDRPLGYVARELMVRGLALFLEDGKLRDDKLSSDFGLKLTKNEPSMNGKLLATRSKQKIPIKKERPAHKKVA